MTFSKINILALSAFALFMAGYFPVWQILVTKWAGSEEYSHAFLALPIILYMVWQKRGALRESQPRFAIFGLLLAIFASALYLFSLLTQVHTLIAMAMLLTMIGAIIYLAGAGAIKELATPLILFAMLIPVPEQLYTQLTFPLQLLVSQASEIIIRAFGITIFREGNIMHLPGKSFEVVAACSGLRSVVTLMTLSVIIGYFLLRNTSTKLILFAASIPTAILVNLIRIVVMVLLYHFFEVDLTEGTLHTVTGLAIFGIALLMMSVLQRVLEFWELSRRSKITVTSEGCVRHDEPDLCGHESSGYFLMAPKRETKFIILAVIFLGTTVLVYGNPEPAAVRDKPPLRDYFQSLSGYKVFRDLGLNDDASKMLKLDDYTFIDYEGRAERINLYIGYYYTAQKASAAHSPLICYPSQGWKIDNRPERRTLPVGPYTLNYQEIITSHDGEKELVFYWYQTYARTSPEAYQNKIDIACNRFMKRGGQHAFVRVSVPFTNTTQAEAEKAGVDFIRAFFPRFIAYFSEAGPNGL